MNIIEKLKQFKVEVTPEMEKAFSGDFLSELEVEKKLAKAQSDRDAWKQRAETAEETFKTFEGIDPSKIQSELDKWKKKAEEAEQKAKDEIYNRDFADALKAELENVKFSSEAAKRAVMAEIKEAGLKLKGDKILGLNDLIEQIKKADASAFVDDNKPKPEVLGAGQISKPDQGAMTRKEIEAIKDPRERQAAIRDNKHLYVKQ